jgi:hypothetical protein
MGTVKDSRMQPLMQMTRSRAVSALGAMVSTDNCVFYTASDVSYKMLRNAGIDPEFVTSDDLEKFMTYVSGVLSTSHKKGTDNVRRTNKRIASKLSSGNAAFGYRIGMALGSELITSDTIQQSRVNTETYEHVTKNKMRTAEMAIAMMTFRELTELELTVQARKKQLYFEMETKYLDAKSKLSSDYIGSTLGRSNSRR